MRALLVIVTLIDLALGALLIAVSGFVLEGVNNTGPMLPEALFFWLMVAACLIAPMVAWAVRARRGLALAVASAPLIVAALALILEPVFV